MVDVHRWSLVAGANPRGGATAICPTGACFNSPALNRARLRTVMSLLGYRFHPRPNWRLRSQKLHTIQLPLSVISPHVSISHWHQACSYFFPRILGPNPNDPADHNGGGENGNLSRIDLQYHTCSGERRLGSNAPWLYHPGHGESSIRSSATSSVSGNPRVPPVRREKFGCKFQRGCGSGLQ